MPSGGKAERAPAEAATGRDGDGLWEVLAAGLMCAALALAVFVTYARLPVRELYHVQREGLAGGAGRVLVLLNFPIALVALPVLGIVVARLRAHARAMPGRRLLASGLGAAAAGLCAITAWPGVVSKADLDARPVNILPAAGVVLTMLLTAWCVRRCGAGPFPRLRGGETSLLVTIAVVALLSLPWLVADLGFYASDLPLVGRLVVARQVLPPRAREPAVHLGHHHGLDGAVMLVAGLVLARALGRMRRSRLRAWVARALALMLAYGAAQFINDLWGEQVVKRGWSSRQVFASALHPAPNRDWAALLTAALLVRVFPLGRWPRRQE